MNLIKCIAFNFWLKKKQNFSNNTQNIIIVVLFVFCQVSVYAFHDFIMSGITWYCNNMKYTTEGPKTGLLFAYFTTIITIVLYISYFLKLKLDI